MNNERLDKMFRKQAFLVISKTAFLNGRKRKIIFYRLTDNLKPTIAWIVFLIFLCGGFILPDTFLLFLCRLTEGSPSNQSVNSLNVINQLVIMMISKQYAIDWTMCSFCEQCFGGKKVNVCDMARFKICKSDITTVLLRCISFVKKNLPFLQFMVIVANRLPMQRNKSQTRQPWTFYEQPMLNENASQLHKTLDFLQCWRSAL